jgi:predicted PurR-regulated permease PerM
MCFSAGISLVILVPVLIVGFSLADNVKELTTAAERWIETGLPSPPDWLAKVPLVGRSAANTWQSLSEDNSKLVATAKRLIEPVGAWVLRQGLKLGGGLLDLALSIVLTFFFLRNGPAVADALRTGVERIAAERGRRLLILAGTTVRGVVYGILGTALLQAVLAGMGLILAGVPGPGVLALLVFFLSVVPGGPYLILLPAALWLFHQDATGWGIFMLVWGVVVSTLDNVVRPWLISQGSAVPFILILLGVLGGAMTFGLIGIFIGPTLLAVGQRILGEWVATRRRAASDNTESLADRPAT